MSKNPSRKLVTFKRGLAPHADPIVCGDIVGADSLFGDEADTPRVVRRLVQTDFNTDDESFASLARANASLIWESEHDPSIIGQPSSIYHDNEDYAVVADTFIFGASSSSFDLAWDLEKMGLMQDWSSVIVTMQKEGRGQMRRNWFSAIGNLYLSFKLPQDPSFSSPAGALVLSYILVRAFKEMGIDIYLKWPNDLLTADLKKLGGVLLEERSGVLMAGLGINIMHIPDKSTLRSEYSLAPVAFSTAFPSQKKYFAPFFLWQELVAQTILAYRSFVAGHELSKIMQEANDFLIIKDRQVLLIDDKKKVSPAFCHGFSDTGSLLLDFGQGQISEISSASVVPNFS